MKTCVHCKLEKPLEHFTTAKSCKDGRRNLCKACKPLRYKLKPADPAFERARALRNNYWPELTPAGALQAYQVIFDKQGGACAICEKKQSELNKPLYVDHCHITDVVRGLLCWSCNSGIGFLEGDTGAAILQKAISYLESSSENSGSKFII
jgi:hypothetical protein